MPFIKTTSNTNGSVFIPDNVDTVVLRNVAITQAVSGLDTVVLRDAAINQAVLGLDTVVLRNAAITQSLIGLDTVVLRDAAITSLLNSGTFNTINVSNLNIL